MRRGMRAPRVPTIRPEMRRKTIAIAAMGKVSMPGLQRREPAHLLQVQGVEEEEATERGEGGDGDRGGRGERDRAEEAQVDQRLPAAGLPVEQADERQRRHCEAATMSAEPQPVARCLDDAVGQAGQQGDDETCPTASIRRARGPSTRGCSAGPGPRRPGRSGC